MKDTINFKGIFPKFIVRNAAGDAWEIDKEKGP